MASLEQNAEHEKQASEATATGTVSDSEQQQPATTTTTLNASSTPADAAGAASTSGGGESTNAPTGTATSFTSAEKEEKEEDRDKEGGDSKGTEDDKEKATPTTTAENAPPAQQKEKEKTSTKKPSLFSHLVHVLIPCIGPTKAHDLDEDVMSNKPVEKKKSVSKKEKEKTKKASSKATTQKDGEKDKKEVDGDATTTNGKRPEPIDTGLAAGFVPVVPSQGEGTPTRTPTDPAVIVPPTPPSHLLPKEVTGGVTSGAVQPPGSTGEESKRSSRHEDGFGAAAGGAGAEGEDEDGDSETNQHDADGLQHPNGDDSLSDEDDEEERLIREGGAGIPLGPDGKPCPLLPSVMPAHTGRKCLVLDMDETLLHSSFKLIPQADYVIPVEIENQYHNVYVIKRPGVDQFLQKMGEIYEVVVFTASLSKYADPVLDKLDVHRSVSYRLFRESCYNHKGNYVKDLSRLGRPIDQTIILDNSPASYIFHPNNAVPVSSWFNDPHDTELTDLCPFLTDLKTVDDVRGILDGSA